MACSSPNSCIGDIKKNDIDLVQPIVKTASQEELDSIILRIVNLEQENRKLRGELKIANEYWEFTTIL